MTPSTLRRSSAADGNAKAKRYMLVVPNGTADLGDLRAMPTNPCTAAHNQVNAVTEGPHTSCRVWGGTVQPSHAGRTARPAPAPAVPPRGHVEPPADGRVLGGAASTTSGHQPVMKYSVLHAQPVS